MMNIHMQVYRSVNAAGFPSGGTNCAAKSEFLHGERSFRAEKIKFYAPKTAREIATGRICNYNAVASLRPGDLGLSER